MTWTWENISEDVKYLTVYPFGKFMVLYTKCMTVCYSTMYDSVFIISV